LSARLRNYDSERTKRVKISTAIDRIKKRSLWTDSVKVIVDTIAGGDSQIVTIGDSAQWVIGGDGFVIPTAEYWTSIGGDGIDDELGIDIQGEGNELELAGVVYIDTDNDSLTADEIAQMVLEVAEETPAYFIIFLGYFNAFSQWIEYAQIN
ncbi:unnamed protein product, partial [marine sediment metagenome]